MLIASTLGLILSGCVQNPPEDYMIKIGKKCKEEYNYVEPYLDDIPHPSSEKIIECMRKKVSEGYEAKELPIEMFSYLDRRFDYNLFLIEKRKKGEITKAESSVMLDEWDKKPQQLAVQTQQPQKEISLLEGLGAVAQQIQPEINRYNMIEQGINPVTGIPYGNERQGFNCNTTFMGNQANTNCY